MLYLMVLFCSTGHSQTTSFYFIYRNLGSFYIIDCTAQLTMPYTQQHQLTTSTTHTSEENGSKGFYVCYYRIWRAHAETITLVHLWTAVSINWLNFALLYAVQHHLTNYVKHPSEQKGSKGSYAQCCTLLVRGCHLDFCHKTRWNFY